MSWRRPRTIERGGKPSPLPRILSSVAIFYLLYAAFMSAAAPFALYQFAAAPFESRRFEMIEVRAADGTMLPVALHDAGAHSPTILVFVGNAGSRDYFRALYEPLLRAGATVVLMPYRGAEGIPGRPSEKWLRADAHAVVEAIPSLLDRAPGPVHLAAYSLGTGLALELSADPGMGDVLLVAPYARICEIMTRKTLLPACWMPWVDHWDSAAFAAKPGSEVTILHGKEDRLIPPRQSEKLAAALQEAGRLKARILIEGAEHNDIITTPAAWAAITSWAEAMVSKFAEVDVSPSDRL